MHTAWSARRTCSASLSAVEYTATASTPSSWSARITRTAISPRFATRTRENIASLSDDRLGVGRLELEEQLTELDRLAALDVDRLHPTLLLCLELVEELHCLEEAER